MAQTFATITLQSLALSDKHMQSPRIACIIPARYASTRFPGKPLVVVKGIPLIMWAVNNALDSGVFCNVAVATDDLRIKDAVESHGGAVIMTSSFHQSGTDRVAQACAELDITHVVNLQGDEPMVSSSLLKDFSQELATLPTNYLLTIVSHATIEEIVNPNVVKAVLARNNDALYFSRCPIPYDRSSSLPSMYRHAGLYGFSKESLLHFCSLPQGILEKAECLEQLRALEHGMRIRCLIRSYPSIGVDTPEDLERFKQIIGDTP